MRQWLQQHLQDTLLQLLQPRNPRSEGFIKLIQARTDTFYRRSSRSKRKMERKVGSGRKGTIDEEEYLLTSIGKLITRLNTMEGTVPWFSNVAGY